MSNRPTDSPGDWRRQRRPSAGSRQETPASPKAEEPTPESGEEAVLSRTMGSFLEPALDAVGSFAAPLLVAGIVGLVSGAAVLVFVSSMRVYGWITFGAGTGLVLMIGLIYLSSVMAAFFSRTGRYGVNSVIMVVAFTGIIVVVNFISFENHSRMDVTATNEFSLATRTKLLLKDLDEPVRATAFYVTDFNQDPEMIARRARVENTLRELDERSGKFTYRFMDPDLNPEIARNYGLTQYESVVVEAVDSGITDMVERTRADPDYARLEQDLVTSLLVVTGQQRKTIYFLSGHGERSINSRIDDGEGYTLAKDGLEQDNYDVRTLRWRLRDEDVSVPDQPDEDCLECLPGAALLVIAGPTQDMPEAHARVLDLFLQGRNADGSPRREAGRLVVLADPDTPDSFRSFLAGWGLVLGSGYIRDLSESLPQQPRIFRADPYLPQSCSGPACPPGIAQITIPRGVELGTTLMGAAAPIVPIVENFAALAFTSGNSYMIEDLERTEPVTDGDQSDPRGPFFPAVYVGPAGGEISSAEPPSNEVASLVVFGDADFIANSFLTRPGGSPDLFLNSANFLLGDYSLVSIRPKAFAFREFNLDRNEHNFVRFSSWLFMPGLLALMAGVVWWVRR